MKFEKTKVFNMEGAFRGLRNPKDSWDRSDSYTDNNGNFIIGPADMKLAQTMIRGGSCECKFLRQIFVSVDITANLQFWSEFDTYRVGVTANSCSKMHKIQSYPINLNRFEIDNYNRQIDNFDVATSVEKTIIPFLEALRQRYNETKDKRYWYELIRWLPQGWLQKRTITMSYENIRAMCSPNQRRNHKLNWWSGRDNPNLVNFIAWARSLPYAQELLFSDELDKKQKDLTNRIEYYKGYFKGYVEAYEINHKVFKINCNNIDEIDAIQEALLQTWGIKNFSIHHSENNIEIVVDFLPL